MLKEMQKSCFHVNQNWCMLLKNVYKQPIIFTGVIKRLFLYNVTVIITGMAYQRAPYHLLFLEYVSLKN